MTTTKLERQEAVTLPLLCPLIPTSSLCRLPGGQESDKGAVTVVDVAPGVLTSAVVDNVGFDNLEDLAGRGVMVCLSACLPACLLPVSLSVHVCMRGWVDVFTR